MKVISAASHQFIPASHEPAADPNVWKKVLATSDVLHRGKVQMINWARMGVGRSFCPHYHEDMQEIFIIVAGSARAEVSGVIAELACGDAIIIEPGEVHVLTNSGACELQYIAIGISGEKNGKTVVV